MKTISLELDGIEVLIIYEPEYREVIEADTPLGSIVRDALFDIEILDITGVKYGDNWEGEPFKLGLEELYSHISHADLLEVIDSTVLYI